MYNFFKILCYLYIFRLKQLAALLMLFLVFGLILVLLLILCLGDTIWEYCNEIFGDFLIRAPVENDGKGSVDHEH